MNQEVESRERLAKVLTSLQITQTKLAQLIDSDSGTVTKLLNGNRPIGRNMSLKIITKLGLNPVWWESGEGEMFLTKPASADPPPSSLESENEKRLAAELIAAQREIIRLKDQLLDKEQQENKRLQEENARLRKD